MYADGYKYWMAYKKQNISYFRCRRYRQQCGGRCVIEDGKVRNTADHNHPPEPDRALVDRFRKVLTHRAASEKKELYAIYWEEATLHHSEAALLYTYTQAEGAMRKARRKQLPRTPKTIQELGDILSIYELFQIHTGSNHDPFYQTSISTAETTCAIFMHKKTIGILEKVDELHIDASFYVQPQTPPSYYIFTAHSIQSDQNCPILYAITTNKNQHVFSSIFAYLREQLSNFAMPTIILSEFDYDMQLTLNYTFPEATVKGNWYHYAENIVKQMMCYGLERETAKGHGASALRMLMVLPLLPAEYMAPGLEALKKWMKEKLIFSQGFFNLCSYVETSWLRLIGAEKMSIFGLNNCLNTQVKTFNTNLRQKIGTQNPKLWNILECLTVIATKNFVRLSKKVKSSNNPPVKPPKGKIVVETIIKNATQMWIRSAVHLRNPLQFLQLCSHCIQDINNFMILDDGKSYIKNVTTIPPTTSTASVKTPTNSTTSNFSLINDSTLSVMEVNLTSTTPATKITTISNVTTATITSSTTTNATFSTKQFLNNQPQTKNVQLKSNVIPVKTASISSTEPPPLVFFPTRKFIVRRPTDFRSEPPPLAPIGSKR